MTKYFPILLGLLLITLASPAATCVTYDMQITNEVASTTPVIITCHTNTGMTFPKKSLKWSFWYRFNLTIDGQTQSASCDLIFGKRRGSFTVFDNNKNSVSRCPNSVCDWRVREKELLQHYKNQWVPIFSW